MKISIFCQTAVGSLVSSTKKAAHRLFHFSQCPHFAICFAMTQFCTVPLTQHPYQFGAECVDFSRQLTAKASVSERPFPTLKVRASRT